MRIVIDMQGAQTASRFRGIGRYSRALALAMAQNAGEHEIFLALNGAFPESIADIHRTFAPVLPKERILVFAIPSPVAECDPLNIWRARAAEKIREYFLHTLQPDAVVLTSLFEGFIDNASTSVGKFCSGGTTAVILYDLIPLMNPDTYLADPAHREYYERKIESLQNAGLLLSISAYSRLEAINRLGFTPQRVVNISTAADAHFKPHTGSSDEITQLLLRLGITRKMVMYAPGGFDPRKNLDGLITAYSLLPDKLRTTHQLVIASKLSEPVRFHLEQISKSAGLAADELILTDYLTETELQALYSSTTLFVFPSKHEGFGLPALEAMACGAPVIGANNTSIPEVIGCTEALFDASSTQSIADKIAQVLQDEPMRNRLRMHGMEQASRFSWDETAKRAITALEKHVNTLSEAHKHFTESDIVKAVADIQTTVAPEKNDLVSVANCIADNNSMELPEKPIRVHSEISVGSQGASPLQLYTGYEDQDCQILKKYTTSPVSIADNCYTDGFGVTTQFACVPFLNPEKLDPQRLQFPVPDDGFHAEAIEYVALTDALQRSEGNTTFSAVEIGAGWGPWITTAGVIAKKQNKNNITLVGVEASSERFDLMTRHLECNALRPPAASGEDAQYKNIFTRLFKGAVWTHDGVIWFPESDVGDMGAAATTKNDATDYRGTLSINRSVPCKALPTLLHGLGIIDFLHIDIQGSELELLQNQIDWVSSNVRAMMIATHSRAIEGKLLELLYEHGWQLHREKPCRVDWQKNCSLVGKTNVDGSQYWLNLKPL